MDSTLGAPFITENTIRSINFFNGRLLSGEDLNQEKAANRDGRKQLGRAIGDGVAHGLEVKVLDESAKAPVLGISPGLAVNRRGRALALADDVALSLVRPPDEEAVEGGVGFDDCLPPQDVVYAVDDGVYLLTIGPADVDRGAAQVSGLGNSAAGCNWRYKVEGVQFRLISMIDTFAPLLSDKARLRNRVAYRCFGYGPDDARLGALIANPFGATFGGYGALDDLRPDPLTDCQVPLAVLHWSPQRLEFVDMWAVRRRITHPGAGGASPWAALTSDRRAAEGEAMFLQFQAQVEEIRNDELNLERIAASQRFNTLPAVGILPMADHGGSRGFRHNVFLNGIPYRNPIIIEGAQVPSLLREACAYPPITVGGGEAVWVYWVRANLEAAQARNASRSQAYWIFASGHLPFRGDAKYDVNRWSFANYGGANA